MELGLSLSLTGLVTRQGGGGGGSPALDLLDGADQALLTAAWSFRRLRSAHIGPLVRIRRSSDNAEQDFGSDQLAVSTAEVATFIGGGSGFVRTRYDQVGSNDLIQATAADQPAYLASAIGGRPGCDYVTGDYMTAHGIAAAFSGSDVPFSASSVLSCDALTGNQSFLSLGNSANNTAFMSVDMIASGNPTVWRIFRRDDASAIVTLEALVANTVPNNHFVRFTGSTIDYHVFGSGNAASGVAFDVGTMAVDRFGEGCLFRTGPGNFFDGKVAETIIFAGAISAGGRTLLSEDTIDYYSIEMPVVQTLSSPVRQALPDASGGDVGQGFTCTGMCFDAADNRYWISNDGRSDAVDITYAPSLVQTSLDGATKLAEIILAPLYPSIESVQGVAHDTTDNTLWFASLAENRIRHITKAGANIGELTVTAPNGLCYDSLRDVLWCMHQGFNISRITKAGVTEFTFNPGISDLDQLFYDAVNDLVWITAGANGSPGTVRSYSPVTSLLGKYIYTLAITTATEGCFVDDTKVIVMHDGYFHATTPNVNEMQTYLREPPLSGSAGLYWFLNTWRE